MSDSIHAPWWIVPSDDKKRARINCISHILDQIPYERHPLRCTEARQAAEAAGRLQADTGFRNVVPDVF